MCWKHEMKYKGMCYDHIWGLNITQGIKDILEIDGGIHFNNEVECKKEFFDLLTSWHEKKLIKPEVENGATH